MKSGRAVSVVLWCADNEIVILVPSRALYRLQQCQLGTESRKLTKTMFFNLRVPLAINLQDQSAYCFVTLRFTT